MDANLKTASTYVNNLLLARGLLRNGTPVDFTSLLGKRKHRSKHDRAEGAGENAQEKEEDSSQVVVQVINLVHDMILRRDRDQDHLASLSHTLSDLRSSQTTQTTKVSHLETRTTDLQRQLSASTSSVRSANSALHTAEASARQLREELTRAKITLAQVRQQCANDVRKRDVQIQRLKTHLTGTQRGSNTRIVGASCSISTGRGRDAHPLNGSAVGGHAATNTGGTFNRNPVKREHEDQPSLEDASYSLKQETNEFLTQLSQSMSEENDSLIGLVRETLGSLREMLGLPPISSGSQGHGDANSGQHQDELVSVVPSSYETLSGDLASVLGRLQAILTRDDFVPINEVYARDEEILRLRDGWERMGSRWKEAVEMMHSWQEKLSGGGVLGAEDLTRGLTLGQGLELVDHAAATAAQQAGKRSLVTEQQNEQQDEQSDESMIQSRDDRDPIFDSPNLSGRESGTAPASSSPPASPPVSKALQEASPNVASPSSATARARRLRQQQRRDRTEQENTTTQSKKPTRSTSSTHAMRPEPERTLDLDLKGLNLTRNGPRISANTTTTGSTTNTRSSAPRLNRTSTTPAESNTSHSRNRPTSQAKTQQSPLHKHLTSIFSSSSPDASPSPSAQKTRSRSSPAVAAKNRTRTRFTPSTNGGAASPSRGSRRERRPAHDRNSSGLSEGSLPDFQAQEAEDGSIGTELPESNGGGEDVGGMTVSAKLKLVEDEARRASGNFFPSSSPVPAPPVSHEETAQQEGQDHQGSQQEAAEEADGQPLAMQPPTKTSRVVVVRSPLRSPTRPEKRAKVRGAMARGRRKRKSTLSPEELEVLMGLGDPTVES